MKFARSDMSPAFALGDAPNSMSGDGVVGRDTFVDLSGGGTMSDGHHVVFSNFGKAASRATDWIADVSASAPNNAVPDIFGLRPADEMSGVYARRVVTSMPGQKFTKRALMDFIGHSVRLDGSVIIRDNSVSLGCARPRPLPAFIFTANRGLGPEMASNATKVMNMPLALKGLSTRVANDNTVFLHGCDNSSTGVRGQLTEARAA